MLKYELSDKAYNQYITCTKGNKDLPFELAELKLNRNIKHGTVTKVTMNGFTFKYGTLAIVVENNKIVNIYQTKKWIRIKKFEYS